MSSGREDLIHLGAVADQLLLRAAAEADGDDIEMETVSRQGDPAQVLADVATEENAQLIIVGDRGLSGVERFPSRQRLAQGLASRAVQRAHRAGQPSVGDTDVGNGHAGRSHPRSKLSVVGKPAARVSPFLVRIAGGDDRGVTRDPSANRPLVTR